MVLSHLSQLCGSGWAYILMSSLPQLQPCTTDQNVSKLTNLFLRFCRTWTKRYLITSQTKVKRVSRIHHRTILARNRLSLFLPFILSFVSLPFFLNTKMKLTDVCSYNTSLNGKYSSAHSSDNMCVHISQKRVKLVVTRKTSLCPCGAFKCSFNHRGSVQHSKFAILNFCWHSVFRLMNAWLTSSVQNDVNVCFCSHHPSAAVRKMGMIARRLV